MGVTLCIKLLFFKLSQSSFQSMAKMRKIQPRLKELQERFADDRPRFNKEMMDMYKREKVNPLGGCLPILVQIPVFISLYWVLIETVEIRQAPFMLWIQDLSAQDPFYLLPLLYGITMKIQQGLNPAPIDPVQAKVMKMFPIVFTIFFLFFPPAWFYTGSSITPCPYFSNGTSPNKSLKQNKSIKESLIIKLRSWFDRVEPSVT